MACRFMNGASTAGLCFTKNMGLSIECRTTKPAGLDSSRQRNQTDNRSEFGN